MLTAPLVAQDVFNITVYPTPLAPQAVVGVAAAHDAYIPPFAAARVAKLWRGAKVHWVPGGHVTAFLLNQDVYPRAIVEALLRLPPPTSRRAASARAASARAAAARGAAAQVHKIRGSRPVVSPAINWGVDDASLPAHVQDLPWLKQLEESRG